MRVATESCTSLTNLRAKILRFALDTRRKLRVTRRIGSFGPEANAPGQPRDRQRRLPAMSCPSILQTRQLQSCRSDERWRRGLQHQRHYKTLGSTKLRTALSVHPAPSANQLSAFSSQLLDSLDLPWRCLLEHLLSIRYSWRFTRERNGSELCPCIRAHAVKRNQPHVPE
jgi:hypothetical protein